MSVTENINRHGGETIIQVYSNGIRYYFKNNVYLYIAINVWNFAGQTFNYYIYVLDLYGYPVEGISVYHG